MRNLLAFVGAAVVSFLALGWYLDWYHVQSTPTAAGKRTFSIDVNTKKIGEDVHKGVSAGEEKLKGVLKNDNATGMPADSLLQEAEYLGGQAPPKPPTTAK